METKEKFEMVRGCKPVYFYAPEHVHEAINDMMAHNEETDEG